MIVTLDGPAGSGKSTTAWQLASRLGVEMLDTGAMYRGITAKALDRGIDIATEPHAVIELARSSEVRFDWTQQPPRLWVGRRDMTDRLRDHDVTNWVSDVSSMPAIRHVMVKAQRRIASEHPRLVTEGRDQGSVVFPDADAKFYLDASPQVRAKRRADQLRAAGKPVDLDQIREAIILRDRKDAARKDGPLICPEDAQRIDTSDMTSEQVVDFLAQRVRALVEVEA
ncbi:Cytidylate kinase [Mucisphaera calidilacus]|uniref:Cytidylate kinase n=2 Tax=Mucisphaera calidilacus TaxID=2527982 RepID=A0A518BWI8_9BACT|nr:Cytidylate kinase [Mucisphaera calidilacus]